VSIETTITVETAVAETPRVMQVQGMFDLAPEKTARQSWSVRMPFHGMNQFSFLRFGTGVKSLSEVSKIRS
jgi:hypothetical protein